MNVEIQRADRSLRRRTFMVLSAAVLAAVLFMILFHAWMGRAARTLPDAQFVFELRRMIAFAVICCGLCVMVLAAYAARLAHRVTEQQRWPLRGVRVMRDTRVRSGSDAMAMARMLNMAAITLIALAIGFGMLSWRLFGVA
ncbi:MAG: hypothetical protein ACREPX_06435 [Rhodanobacteraceae bacterium]